MATYYPSCLSQAEYCTKCNTAQDPGSACTSSSSKNSSEKESACSAYCDSGCNSSCNTAQTVCKKMGQYIKNHADVGAYNDPGVCQGEFIHKIWTEDYWNTLISKIDAAEDIGRLSSHGSAGSVTAPIGDGALYTAKLYNEVRKKLCNFNVSYSEVEAHKTIISKTVADAIKTAYNNAQFNSSVCDMCNSDQTMRGGCGCNCSCSCSCNCGCSCPCSCHCGCSCGCSNPCSCGSHTPTPSS